MDSEQTKRLQMEANAATPKNESEFHACYIEEWVEISRRLDLLESAERERQQPKIIPLNATPTPAAAKPKCRHPVVMDIPDNKHRCVDCGFIMDRPFIPLSPPAQPAPPPADVVRREDVLEAFRRWKEEPGAGFGELRGYFMAIPSAPSPAPDVRAEAEMWKRCREAVADVSTEDISGYIGPMVVGRCGAAIDALKPTATAGTGGEGGKE